MSLSRTEARGKPLALGVLLLQLLLVAAVPSADAHLEAQAYQIAVHIESGDSDCGYAHDHTACQLCRALHLAGHPPVQPVSNVLGTEPVAAPAEVVESHVPTDSSTLPLGSRAPPVLGS